jgi:subtilisin family serine protease
MSSYHNNVIAVGASWQNGQRLSYSNYGSGLTLMGPSEVPSTAAIRSFGETQFFDSKNFNGTSAATPNVAGVASLVWSANRNLSASQIKGILSQTAFDLGARGDDLTYGHGFINADAAVRQALALSRSGNRFSFSLAQSFRDSIGSTGNTTNQTQLTSVTDSTHFSQNLIAQTDSAEEIDSSYLTTEQLETSERFFCTTDYDEILTSSPLGSRYTPCGSTIGSPFSHLFSVSGLETGA